MRDLQNTPAVFEEDAPLPQDADFRLRAHPRIGEVGKQRLQEGGPVVLIGAGGLGHPLAGYLGAMGVPLVIADSGLVEPVNVGLQLFSKDEVGMPKTEAVRRRLLAVRPALPIRTYSHDVKRLGPGLFINCRLILGCLDNWKARIWLAQRACHLKIPYLDLAVDGSGLSLYGRVHGAHPTQGTACMACGWDSFNWDDVHREQGGAGCTALMSIVPEAPPTLAFPGLSAMVAGLGVIQATRLLVGFEQERVLGREVRLNLSTGQLQEIRLDCDPACRLSHRPWDVHVLNRPASQLTVEELLERAIRDLGAEARLAVPDDMLVQEAACPTCRRTLTLVCLRSSVPACPACGGKLIPVSASSRFWFGREELEPLLGRAWQQIGLAPFGAVIARKNSAEIAYVFPAG